MKKIERNLHGSSQLSILNVGGFFHLREENLHRGNYDLRSTSTVSLCIAAEFTSSSVSSSVVLKCKRTSAGKVS